MPSVHIDNTEGLVIKDYIAYATDPSQQIAWRQTAMMLHRWLIFSSRGSEPCRRRHHQAGHHRPWCADPGRCSPFPDPGAVRVSCSRRLPDIDVSRTSRRILP